MNELNIFVPINKVNSVNRPVYGVLAAEKADQAGETMDWATGNVTFQDWSEGFCQENRRQKQGQCSREAMPSPFTPTDADRLLGLGDQLLEDWREVATLRHF